MNMGLMRTLGCDYFWEFFWNFFGIFVRFFRISSGLLGVAGIFFFAFFRVCLRGEHRWLTSHEVDMSRAAG